MKRFILFFIRHFYAFGHYEGVNINLEPIEEEDIIGETGLRDPESRSQKSESFDYLDVYDDNPSYEYHNYEDSSSNSTEGPRIEWL